MPKFCPPYCGPEQDVVGIVVTLAIAAAPIVIPAAFWLWRRLMR